MKDKTLRASELFVREASAPVVVVLREHSDPTFGKDRAYYVRTHICQGPSGNKNILFMKQNPDSGYVSRHDLCYEVHGDYDLTWHDAIVVFYDRCASYARGEDLYYPANKKEQIARGFPKYHIRYGKKEAV